MSDDVSGHKCDRHGTHAHEYPQAEHKVVVGNSVWYLCHECKRSLHNWFGSFPTTHDYVAKHENKRKTTTGRILEKQDG